MTTVTKSIQAQVDNAQAFDSFSMNQSTNSDTLILANDFIESAIGLAFRDLDIPANAIIASANLSGHLSSYNHSSEIGTVRAVSHDSWAYPRIAGVSEGWHHGERNTLVAELIDDIGPTSILSTDDGPNYTSWPLDPGGLIAFPFKATSTESLKTIVLSLWRDSAIASCDFWVTLHPLNIKNELTNMDLDGFDPDMSCTLAYSDVVTESSIALSGNNYETNFELINSFRIVEGNYYVAVLHSDYAPSGSNAVYAVSTETTLNTNGLRFYDESAEGFAKPSMQVEASALRALRGESLLCPSAVWPNPLQTGVDSSPDISHIVQSVISQRNYRRDDPIVLSIDATGEGRKYFAAFSHATFNPFSLSVTYTVDGVAVDSVASRRGILHNAIGTIIKL